MKKNAPQGPTLFDLVPDAPRLCKECGGTILAPTIGGVPRGTCRCPRADATKRVTDWSSVEVYRPLKTLPLLACCEKLIERYEAIDPVFASIAKKRGGVALYCSECTSRVEFSDGAWQRKGVA